MPEEHNTDTNDQPKSQAPIISDISRTSLEAEPVPPVTPEEPAAEEPAAEPAPEPEVTPETETPSETPAVAPIAVELPESAAPAVDPLPVPTVHTPHKKGGRAVAIVLFVVLLAAAGAAAYILTDKKDDKKQASQSNTAQTTQTPVNDLKKEANGKYSSQLDKFAVALPGDPEVSKQSIQVDKNRIPVSTYAVSTKGDAPSTYIIGVYDYSGLSLVQNALDNAVDGAVKSINGATLKSKTATKYNNLPAVEAEITVPNNQKPTSARVILNGSKAYALFLVNGDKKDFDAFANSLEFVR